MNQFKKQSRYAFIDSDQEDDVQVEEVKHELPEGSIRMSFITYYDREKAKACGAKFHWDLKIWYLQDKTKYKEFMRKFTDRTDKQRLKDYHVKRIEELYRSIEHNKNADITIPDPKFQKKLQKEIKNYDYTFVPEYY